MAAFVISWTVDEGNAGHSPSLKAPNPVEMNRLSTNYINILIPFIMIRIFDNIYCLDKDFFVSVKGAILK